MAVKSKNTASVEEIKALYNRAEGHNLYYDEENEETRHIEAFLPQTVLIEGVLVNLGLKLLEGRADLCALKGKRGKWYGYDNAINDLYLLGTINTEEFKKLEQFKNERNKYIHNLLSKELKNIETEVYKVYEDYKNLALDMIAKLEKKLSRPKE